MANWWFWQLFLIIIIIQLFLNQFLDTFYNNLNSQAAYEFFWHL